MERKFLAVIYFMQKAIFTGILLFLVILLGLASRQYTWLFPQTLGKYPGDGLWAIAVYLTLAFLLPKLSSLKLVIFSLVISYGVELSQLYQANWINRIRENSIGHLFLGSTFSYLDLVAYTVGIIVIFLFDKFSNA